jgi:hypothetical protein
MSETAFPTCRKPHVVNGHVQVQAQVGLQRLFVVGNRASSDVGNRISSDVGILRCRKSPVFFIFIYAVPIGNRIERMKSWALS